MRRAVLALALAIIVFCAFVVARLYAHTARIAALESRVNQVTARCAALNAAKHEMVTGRAQHGGAEVAKLDVAIDRCERELRDADLAWGAEVERSGWQAVW